MTQFFIFLIIGVVGVVFVYYLVARRKEKKMADNIIAAQGAEKEANIIKLKDFLRGKDEITNDGVEKLLGVSHATAERYLNDLEKEGLLKQIGKIGRAVHYRRIT